MRGNQKITVFTLFFAQQCIYTTQVYQRIFETLLINNNNKYKKKKEEKKKLK